MASDDSDLPPPPPLDSAEDQAKFLSESLHALNPPATHNDDLSVFEDQVNESTALRVSGELFKGILEGAPKGSAPGAMGWTFRLIQQMVRGHPDPAIFCEKIVLYLINPMLAGKLNCQLWTTSRAVLIPKKSPGWRPLAIGDAWYRLMARTAMRACGVDVGKKLRPQQ
eukprot:gene43317-58663_t